MKLEDLVKEHKDDYGESRVELREDGIYLVLVRHTHAIAVFDGLDGFHPVEEFRLPEHVARRIQGQLDSILAESKEAD